jgi:hypothetical protein
MSPHSSMTDGFMKLMMMRTRMAHKSEEVKPQKYCTGGEEDHMFRAIQLVVLLLLLAVRLVAVAAQGTFTTIDVPGAVRTVASGINARSDIVGGYVSADGRGYGFLLIEGEFTTIDIPGATFTEANGITPGGDIVGDYTTADGRSHGFLLSGDEFTSFDVPGATDTFAFGINARGDIVGPYDSADGLRHGYLLRQGP